MNKEKLYDPEKTGTFQMMFGMKNRNTSGKKIYQKKKNYYYVDKRTKKYGCLLYTSPSPRD